MNINYKETQLDFLQQPMETPLDPRGSRIMAAQLTLSVENLVILTIMSIMVMIFCFSIGVERGKKVAFSDIKGARVVATTAAPPADTSDEGGSSSAMPVRMEESDAGFFRGVTALFGGKTSSPSDEQVSRKSVSAVEESAKTTAVSSDGPTVDAASAGEAPSTEVSSGAYTVQVASYKTRKSALVEAKNLEKKGYRDIQVLPKGAYVILCVGNFSTQSDAKAYTSKLRKRYQDSLVRRL